MSKVVYRTVCNNAKLDKYEKLAAFEETKIVGKLYNQIAYHEVYKYRKQDKLSSLWYLLNIFKDNKHSRQLHSHVAQQVVRNHQANVKSHFESIKSENVTNWVRFPQPKKWKHR